MNLVDKYGDVFKRIDGSFSHHDHVRHYLYEGIFSTLEAEIKDNPLWAHEAQAIEFGCRLPTSSVIRILMNLSGMRFDCQAVEYPEVDIQDTPYLDNQWDIVIADQVLEHVERPWLAANELRRIVKPGGLAIVATPFLHPLHYAPLDCWRFGLDGYRVLFPEKIWETLTLDTWGNEAIVRWEYSSPITRGLSGEWLTVAQARALMPEYDTPADGKNPIVIWGIFKKKP